MHLVRTALLSLLVSKDPATIFDVICEVAAPSNDGKTPPFVLWRYPENYSDDAILKAITQFSFPLGAGSTGSEGSDEWNGECSSAVQLFSFVLTDGSGRHTFGHCRHAPRSNTTLCLCTALPWPNVFYKILNHVADVMNSVEKEGELMALLERAYLHGVPSPGEALHIDAALGRHKLEVMVPDTSHLPTMQDNRNLMEYWNAVGETNMCSIFASMLRERRIVFTGPKLGQLSSCVLAASLLIRPMYWQHIFVPVLPVHLSSYLSAPMPYIIGVPTSTLELVQQRGELDLHDTVVVHVHDKRMHTPFNDYDSLPSQRAILRRQLERCNAVLGDGLCRAFLRVVVSLLGGYRSGLVRRESDTDIHFDTDKFIAAQKPFLKPFLEEMRHLQIFQEFVNERVAALNSGDPIDDEFEAEIRVFDIKDFSKDLMRERGRDALSGLSVAVGKVVKDPSSALSVLSSAAGMHPSGSQHRMSAGGSALRHEKSPRASKKRHGQPQSFGASSMHSTPMSEKVKRRPQSSFYAIEASDKNGAATSDLATNCSPADDALQFVEGEINGSDARRFGAVFEHGQNAVPKTTTPTVFGAHANRVQSTPNLLAVSNANLLHAAVGGSNKSVSGSRAPSRCPSNLQWSSRATAASSAASLSSVNSNVGPSIDLIDLSLGDPSNDDDSPEIDSFDPLVVKKVRDEKGVPGRDGRMDGRLTPPTLAAAGDLLSAFFDTATHIETDNPILTNLIPESTLGTVPATTDPNRHLRVQTEGSRNSVQEKQDLSPRGQWVSFE